MPHFRRFICVRGLTSLQPSGKIAELLLEHGK